MATSTVLQEHDANPWNPLNLRQLRYPLAACSSKNNKQHLQAVRGLRCPACTPWQQSWQKNSRGQTPRASDFAWIKTAFQRPRVSRDRSQNLTIWSHQCARLTKSKFAQPGGDQAVAQKNRDQNGTLVSGHMDQNLRNPSLLNFEPHPSEWVGAIKLNMGHR